VAGVAGVGSLRVFGLRLIIKAMQVTVDEAKAGLARLLERVESGEEIIISRSGKPVARLAPLERGAGRGRLGSAAGEFRAPDDFDSPLPPEIEDAFWR
jgi:prevent-host-death family protein